jgi:WD40 repeat protein
VLVSGSTDSTVRLWDLGRDSMADTPFSGHVGRVGTLAVGNSYGRAVLVSGADDGVVRVWDLANGSPVGEPLTGHADWVRTVAVCESGPNSYVVSGSYDRSVRVWNLTTGALVQAMTDRGKYPVIAVAPGDPNGRPIVLSCASNNAVEVIDLATGERIHRNLYKHAYPILAVAAGQIGGDPVLAVATYDNALHLWTHESTRPVRYFLTAQKAKGPLVELISHDRTLALATGDQEGVLALWKLGQFRGGSRIRLGRHGAPKLRRIDSTVLPGPITAIADRTDGTVAAAVGDTIILDPFGRRDHQIQLDARVRAMRFAGTGTLVVSTVQGLVSIRLSAGR